MQTPPETDSRWWKIRSNASAKPPSLGTRGQGRAIRPGTARRHGSAKRWPVRMIRSPMAASSTVSPPATTTLDLKKMPPVPALDV